MEQSRTVRLFYFVVFVILVGFLAFAIVSNRHSDKKTANKPANGSSQAVAPSAPGTSSHTQTSQAGDTQESGTQQSGQPRPNNGNSSSSPQNLANTGPTETIGTFIGSVVVGTAAAHMYLRRRTASNLSV